MAVELFSESFKSLDIINCNFSIVAGIVKCNYELIVIDIYCIYKCINKLTLRIRR